MSWFDVIKALPTADCNRTPICTMNMPQICYDECGNISSPVRNELPAPPLQRIPIEDCCSACSAGQTCFAVCVPCKKPLPLIEAIKVPSELPEKPLSSYTSSKENPYLNYALGFLGIAALILLAKR